MVNTVIGYIVDCVDFCLSAFGSLLTATGTVDLWIAGILFAVFMSVILIPLRGGRSIGSGLVGFTYNKIHDANADKKKPVRGFMPDD